MFNKILELLREQEEDKPNKFTIYMGEAIKAAREEAGMSQGELAEMIYRRRATLSDIETGKADVDAGTLWLLSAYLKKPLSYFYPPYARENIKPEEYGPLEHEMFMHFMDLREDTIKKLVINLVKTIKDFNPQEFSIEHEKPRTKEGIEAEENFVNLFGIERDKKIKKKK